MLGIDRRAKYLLIRLDDGQTLIAHLGMSGRMTLHDAASAAEHPFERHDHVVIETDEGWQVRFNDARRFGLMLLVADEAVARHKLFKGLGPEPLDEAFDGAALAGRLKGRRTPIKAALLDQKTLVGVGNIYACEALFLAGISPRRSAHTVQGERAERLVAAIKQVLLPLDRRWRLDLARPRPAGRRARLFSDPLQRLRPRRHRLSDARLRQDGAPAGAVRPLDLLLRALPALAKSRQHPGGSQWAPLREHPDRNQGPRRHHPAQPTEGAECALRRPGARARPGARRLRGRSRHRLHGADRQRQGLRRRRRHQGDEGQVLPGRLPAGLHHRRLGEGEPGAQADRRRGRGLCAGRRLRDGDDVRLHHRRRQRQVRPARDHARHHPGRRRHAAPAALRRQVEGHGHGPDRPHDGRGRSRALRPGEPRRAARRS